MRPAPKPTKSKRRKAKRVNTRKELERELEGVIRELVWWRDGGICIEASIDGGRCGGPIQWGHFEARRASSWLKLTIATFCQCRNHNGLEHTGDKTMTAAVMRLLGPAWIANLQAEKMAHHNERPSEDELRVRLEWYRKLMTWRPTLYDAQTLLEAGYYGPA